MQYFMPPDSVLLRVLGAARGEAHHCQAGRVNPLPVSGWCAAVRWGTSLDQ